MRSEGRATTAQGLMNWPDKKLLVEIAKQIRIDCGGQDPKSYIKRLLEIECQDLTGPQLEAVAEFAYAFTVKQLLGSRKRTRSKIDELIRRTTEEI